MNQSFIGRDVAKPDAAAAAAAAVAVFRRAPTQVAQPLIKWFKSKSQLCRENEVKAIRQFLEKAKEETEEERNARIEEDIAWIAALRVENLSMVYALDREE